MAVPEPLSPRPGPQPPGVYPGVPFDSGIYGIRNILNGKIYVGSAVNMARRVRQHKSSLCAGVHHSRHLQHAWNAYLEGGFEFFCVESVEDIANLIAREQFWIDRFSSHNRANGYNSSPTAGSPLGSRRTEESKAKMIAAQTKRFEDPAERRRASERFKKLFQDPVARMKNAVAQTKRFEDPAERRRASEAAKKRFDDPAERAKVSEGGKRRFEDPAQRAKASEAAAKGRKKRWEHPAQRARASDVARKRYEDPAERAKTSRAINKRYEDPAERAKISVAMKKQWEDPAEKKSRSEAISVAMKKRYEDPAERIRASQEANKRYEDPAYKGKVQDAIKRYWANKRADAASTHAAAI